MTTALIGGGLVLVLLILFAAAYLWGQRAGRTAEQAGARAGAEEIRAGMDDVAARPPADDGAVDGWLRRGRGSD